MSISRRSFLGMAVGGKPYPNARWKSGVKPRFRES